VRFGRAHTRISKTLLLQIGRSRAEKMGHVFPEIRNRQEEVEEVIQREEEAFNKTVEEGLAVFEELVAGMERLEKRVNGLREQFARHKAGNSDALQNLVRTFIQIGPSTSVRFDQAGADSAQRKIAEIVDKVTASRDWPEAEVATALDLYNAVHRRFSGT